MLSHEKGTRFKQGASQEFSFTGLFSFVESSENADDGKHAPCDVNYGSAGSCRLSRHACHVRQTSHHLNNLVHGVPLFVRAFQETFEGGVDELWILSLHLFISKP